jgi:hypothetical protein
MRGMVRMAVPRYVCAVIAPGHDRTTHTKEFVTDSLDRGYDAAAGTAWENDDRRRWIR